MLTPSYVLQFTAEDMRRFAGEAWGALGVNIVEQWVEFNARYFDGVLKPIPIVITNAQPYGHCLAFCSYGGNASGRTITLNFPRARDRLLANRNSLLHEMVHQFLFERGENPAHAGEPWRREITRLTKLITGKTIWAGRSKTARVDGRVVRINAPHPKTGAKSLPQKLIARWPHDGVGIDLGRFQRRNIKLGVTA